jgi:hypothetical protein
MPEDEIGEALRPEIPFIVELLAHYYPWIHIAAGSLLERMTEYGEWAPNFSCMSLMWAKASFAKT